MEFNKELCEEKHRKANNDFTALYKIAEKHEERLTNMEVKQATFFERIDNLVESIDKQSNTLKWIIGLIVPTIISVLASVVLQLK